MYQSPWTYFIANTTISTTLLVSLQYTFTSLAVLPLRYPILCIYVYKDYNIALEYVITSCLCISLVPRPP